MKDVPPLATCPACAAEFDVSSCPPFSLTTCPNCGETTRVRTAIQHYQIEREIGRGGMSQVFLAKDPSLDRYVALKVLLDKFNQDDDRLKQFEKEAQITASFTHPHVVKVYAVGRDHGDLFIVMELVENGNLDELILSQGKVPERQALAWAHETAQGLQAAYQDGLIHRDVKPGNILLAKDRSAKLVDFGLALMFQRETDESEDVWATPFYVSPEKLMGQAEDHRSDIYSLGATLYHLLVGTPSFEVVTGSYEELHTAKTQPVPMKALTAQASPGTCGLIDRMMAVNPDDRPADYESLLSDIESVQSGGTSGNAGSRFLAPQRSKHKALSRTPLIAVAICLTLLAAGFVWMNQTKKTVQPTQKPVAQLDLGSSETEPSPFAQARAQLLAGDWMLAGEGFDTVHQAPDTPSGVRQWALYHGALCNLLNENRSSAVDTLRILEAYEGPRRDLNSFFQGLSETMLESRPISKQVAVDMPEGFCHPLALLAYGLMNWNLEAFQDANTHWQRFVKMQPDAEFQWIAAYKPLIQNHLADLEAFKKLPAPKSLTNAAAVHAELRRIPVRKTKSKTKKARSLLTKRKARLEKRLSELSDQATVNASTRREEEWKAWKALHEELPALGETFQFAKGRALLKERSDAFQSSEGKALLEDHLHLWTKADQLMSWLTTTLPGKEGIIRQRSGNKVSGNVLSITADDVTVQLSSGDLTFPLESIGPWTFARFARKEIDTLTDANRYYEHLEELVAFASLTSLDKIARNHANKLALENRPFRERWARWQAFLKTLSHKPSDEE